MNREKPNLFIFFYAYQTQSLSTKKKETKYQSSLSNNLYIRLCDPSLNDLLSTRNKKFDATIRNVSK